MSTPSAPAAITTAQALDKVLGKTRSLHAGHIMVGVGLAALVPAALGVAQYTTRRDKDDTHNQGLYVIQAILLSIAVVVVIVGGVIWGKNAAKHK